jgi:polar amino acid transport system permease protein
LPIEPGAGRRSRLLAVLLAALVLAGCSGGGYTWGWHVVSPLTEQGQGNIAFLAGGLWQTIAVSLLAIGVSIPLGLIVALPGFARNRALRLLNRSYVEFVRSVPILPLMLWVYYGLPVLTGINFDPFTAGVLTLVISDSAFEAEIFRGGLQSVERGQHEAADALGLSAFDKLWYVILPQAIRRILPPLGNQFVYVLKMSSLLSVIGVFELTKKANELVVTLYRPLEIYSFLILEYFVLVVIVSAGVRWLERRLAADERLARH